METAASNDMVVATNGREISAEILESCRRGDRDAFRVLYETYKDKVYSIALYFFHGDASAASDITQQVFLKLLRSIGQYRGDAGFSTWLYRMVVNACMDSTRKVKPGEVLQEAAEPPAQEDDAVRRQMQQRVQAALSTLPAKFRLPLLLRYFDDLSYTEMAAAMKCSMGTVASRLNRGHKMLAARLEESECTIL